MKTQLLSREDVQRLAPSVFSEASKEGLSDKYQQYPTSKVLDLMRETGWYPVKAQEQRVLNPMREGFQKHLLRFRHEKDIREMEQGLAYIGREFFEIVLTNSHDGTSSYQISAGVYRLVCLNGAVVGNSAFSVKVRHMGNDPRDVINSSMQIAKSSPEIMGIVERMKATMLNTGEKEALALASYQLKWEVNPKERIVKDENGQEIKILPVAFNPSELLKPRRIQDTSSDLWTSFNIIQENMIRGGSRVRANVGLRNLRGVKGINEDMRLNKSLWTLSEEMLKLKRN